MRWTLLLLFSAPTSAATSVLSSALRLESDLPDSRFRVDLVFDAPFLPVDPTLINIMHFMSIISRHELQEQLPPQAYSNLMYRQVQVTTDASEARFLLWGIYLAVRDMIRLIRFHNTVVKLYWDNSLVGQISLTVKTGLSLLYGTRNDTRSIIDYGGEPSLVGSGNKTTEAIIERLNTLSVQNISDRDTTDTISPFSSAKTGNTAFSVLSTSPTIVAPNAPLFPRFTIEFDRVPGAIKLARNDVFLTFYTAILHVAKFPAESEMQGFDTKAPTVTLQVRMYESGIGCMVNSSALT